MSKKRAKDIDERLKMAVNPQAEIKRMQAAAEEIKTTPVVPSEQTGTSTKEPLTFDSLEVLGEDKEGKVVIWSKENRKIYTHDLKNLQYDQLVQIGGAEILRKVGRGKRYDQTADDGSSLWPFPDVKTQLIVAAAKRQLGELSFFGQGVHKLKGDQLLIVNGGHAYIWDGDSFTMQDHPQIEGRLIDWNSGRTSFDIKAVKSRVEAMTIKKAAQTIDEVCSLIDQWGFADERDAYLFVGWMLAQHVQTVWNWRPHIWLSGPAGSGKTMLIGLLESLAGPLAMRREGKSLTEAGFRQDMGNDAVLSLVDEFEKSDARDQIIEYLRSASRGGIVVKGTTSQKAVHFHIRHMALLASIEYRLARAAERSRFLIVELAKDDSRHPVIPNSEKLESLRIEIYAFTLWAAFRAMKLIEELGRIVGFEDRLVESYAVPLSMISVCRENALELLRNMVTAYLEKTRRVDAEDHISDEDKLLRDIAFAKLRVPTERITDDRTSTVYQELTVSQAMEQIQKGKENGLCCDALQAHGIKPTDEGLFLVPEIVTRKLLKDTPWGNLNIDPILQRIKTAKKTRLRIAANRCYGILLSNFIEFTQ